MLSSFCDAPCWAVFSSRPCSYTLERQTHLVMKLSPNMNTYRPSFRTPNRIEIISKPFPTHPMWCEKERPSSQPLSIDSSFPRPPPPFAFVHLRFTVLTDNLPRLVHCVKFLTHFQIQVCLMVPHRTDHLLLSSCRTWPITFDTLSRDAA